MPALMAFALSAIMGPSVQNTLCFPIHTIQVLFGRCHTEFCVTVYNKKVLNSVQPWPRSFSAMCHYTKFDMASEIRREANGEFDSRGIGRIDSLRSRLLGIKEDTAFTEHELTGRWQEEERLKEVLASLQSDRRKVQRIKASSTILNSIDFSICPRCLQDITPEMRIREQYARCCLCNRPLTTTSDAPPKAMPRTEDIDLQIEEAEAVLKDIHQEIETLLNKLGELRTLEAEIGKNLEEEVQV